MYYDVHELKDKIEVGDIMQDRYLIIDIGDKTVLPKKKLCSIFDLHACKKITILLSELGYFLSKIYENVYFIRVKSSSDIAYIEYV